MLTTRGACCVTRVRTRMRGWFCRFGAPRKISFTQRETVRVQVRATRGRRGVVGAEAVVKGRGLELGQRQGGAGAGAEDRGASVARGVGAAQGVDVGAGEGAGVGGD